MDSDCTQLLTTIEHAFQCKAGLDQLHQTIAEQLYPERADFTSTRSLGDDPVVDLYDSTPPQYRAQLASAIGALMRPPAKSWFSMVPDDISRKTDYGVHWLAQATADTRAIIYGGRSRWQPSLQEGDNDVIAFGNAVHSMTESPLRNGQIIFESHHLKDCAWAEDAHRTVNWLSRKIKLQLRNWEKRFPGVKIDPQHARLRETNPFTEIPVYHLVMPLDEYGNFKRVNRHHQYVSLYIDPDKRRIVRKGAYFEFPYTVRRWNLRSGSPYGYSPAAILGLVEARVLQAQSRVILDAGELSVRPPVTVRDEVLGEVALYAGAYTPLSLEYDERMGDAIKPIQLVGDVPIGLEMKVDTREILAAAFLLNKLNLPADKDMTAYEVSERIGEYIRSIGPVVEPMEADNTGLLDNTFAIGMRLKRICPGMPVPEELVGQDIGYEFDTPVQLAYKRQKMIRAQETATFAAGIAKETGKVEVLDNYDWDKIARAGGRSIDGDADWIRPVEEVEAARAAQMEMAKAQAQREEVAQTMGNLNAMADVAGKGVDIGQKLGAIPSGGDGGDQAMLPPGGGGDAGGEWPEEVDQGDMSQLLDLGADEYEEVA